MTNLSGLLVDGINGLRGGYGKKMLRLLGGAAGAAVVGAGLLAAPANAAPAFRNGESLEVGVDVLPGTYFTYASSADGVTTGCSWRLLKPNLLKVVDGEYNHGGMAFAEIEPSHRGLIFQSWGCEDWYAV